jgi:hypothetical protein
MVPLGRSKEHQRVPALDPDQQAILIKRSIFTNRRSWTTVARDQPSISTTCLAERE